MSWSDEEIDGLFREAAARAEVPAYQDSFFDEIAHLLPEQKKKRRAGWWFLPLGILLLGSGVTWFWLAKNSGNKPNLISAIALNQQEQAETQQATPTGDRTTNQLEAPNVVDDKQIPTNIIVQTTTKFDKQIQEYEPENDFSSVGVVNPTEEKTRIFGRSVINPNLALSFTNYMQTIPADRYSVQEKQMYLPYLSFSLPIVEQAPFELQASLPWKFEKRHHIYVGASAGLTEAYVLTGGGSRPMPSARFDLGYQFRKKMYSFEIGLSLSSVKPGDLSLNRSSKVYGFQVDYYSQRITYRSITTLELPLTIRRNIGNHHFGLGIAPTFMLGSVIDFNKVKNGEEIENTRIYGNKLGLNTWGLKPHVDYLFRLKNDLEFGVSMNVQLIQPIDASKFIGDRKQLPFSGQLTFRKYFSIK